MQPSSGGRNRAEMERLASAIEDFVVEGARAAVRTLVQTASVRSGGAPGAPVATGELRGSPRVSLNSVSSDKPAKAAFYPIVGAAEVDQATAALKLGDIVYIKWIAEHANIIEGGRRQDKRGRMIGSIQASGGFVRPAMDESVSRMRRWPYTGGGSGR